MEKVNPEKLRIGRVILVIVFLFSFLTTGFAQYIGGNVLLGGWFPAFHLLILINIILIFASIWYYNRSFIPDELYDEMEGSEQG